MPAELAWSDGQDRQADAVTFAERSDRLKGHVAGSLDRPLVGLLEQEGTDETGDLASHNLANFPLELSAIIARDGLRPCYGQGFRGAPLIGPPAAERLALEGGGLAPLEWTPLIG
jgi:hypothetical protein